MEKNAMRSQILHHISALLTERGLLGEAEKNAMGAIIDYEEMQEGPAFGKGEEIGEGRNL